MRRILLHILIIGLMVPACSSSKENGNGSGDGQDLDLAELPRREISEGGVPFSLAEVPGWEFVHIDSVGWAGWLQRTPENGQSAYYFPEGGEHELTTPHVRIEYIARTVPKAQSADSLFQWLKDSFVNSDRKGQVIREGESLTTLDGHKAPLMAIRTPGYHPNDSTNLSGKTMVWSYVDHGQFLIGFTLSAETVEAYDEYEGKFENLVRSYRSKE